MAEFCNRCADRLGFPEPDIDVYQIFDALDDDHFQYVLCEGCALTAVGKVRNELKVIFSQDTPTVKWQSYDDWEKYAHHGQ